MMMRWTRSSRTTTRPRTSAEAPRPPANVPRASRTTLSTFPWTSPRTSRSPRRRPRGLEPRDVRRLRGLEPRDVRRLRGPEPRDVRRPGGTRDVPLRRPETAGRPESVRPGTAGRPASAKGRPASAKGRPRGRPAPDPVPAMAAPWAGAFDGVPVETTFAADDADESAEIIHDEDDASSASSDGSVEILHEAETEAEAETGADVSGMSGSVSFSGPRSPAVADAEDSTEALHRALAGNDPSSLRDGFASTRPRTSLRDDSRRRPRTSPLASSPLRRRPRTPPKSSIARWPERSHRHPPRDHVLGKVWVRRRASAVGRLRTPRTRPRRRWRRRARRRLA